MTFTEAVELGRTMIKLDPQRWLGEDCGCPTGMAGYAMGVRASMKLGDHPELRIFALFPWLKEPCSTLEGQFAWQRISKLGFDIAAGRKTWDEAIEIIRAMDPDEQAKRAAVESELCVSQGNR